MNTQSHNQLVSFIWSIANDCLRDVYNRGKYRDVILPMVVLRRLDVLLEPTKEEVLEEVRFQKEEAGFTEWDENGLRDASGYVFYNTSEWTLKKLHNTATNSQQILLANFEDYLNGFSENVKEIIEKFKLISQVRHMANKDILLDVLEKYTSPYINLTPNEVLDPDGKKLPALSNLGMGYVFEELIRKFNEENNEEAGEHFTPREIIDLLTRIIIQPVKDNLPPVITIYDAACGSGGMLTEAQNFISDPEGEIAAKSDVYLYGKEINDETYAICKSDMMIKGNNPENIRVGSTLATDEFAGTTFDFMLSNPPYGKSWSGDAKYIKDGSSVIDPRFIITLKNYWGEEETVDATPRTSDGQLLFMMEMVNKMKPLSQSPNGSRIATVQNGSSLFTGDAGGGESNIRRYLIENDLVECIIQNPENMFYNTGIKTYVWVLSNNKAAHRKGKILLIDATERYSKLRKNLGNKNREYTSENISEILEAYTKGKNMERTSHDSLVAKVFDNEDFGYYKVTIERPNRLKSQFTADAIADLRFDKGLQEPMQWAYKEFGDKVYTNIAELAEKLLEWCENNGFELKTKQKQALLNKNTWAKALQLYKDAEMLLDLVGDKGYTDYNQLQTDIKNKLKAADYKIAAGDLNKILAAVSVYDETAEKVIKKVEKFNEDKLNQLLQHLSCTVDQLPQYGYYPTGKANEYIVYESSSDHRDSESVPLKQNIYDYFKTEVEPHVPEAWIDLDKTKIGYEISFNKYFYQHKPLRSIEEVSSEIFELEQENEGLIMDILNMA